MSQFDATRRGSSMPKLRQNSTSVGASPQTSLGELTAFPAAFKGRKGRGGKERREGEESAEFILVQLNACCVRVNC